MSMYTDNTLRHCSRCGLPLDDPSSREKGQGPICSAKDTHLYAKTIPANLAVAMVHALAIKSEMLIPDCKELWEKTLASLLKKTENLQKANTENLIVLSGADLRETVKTADYMCSFVHPDRTVKSHLIGLVRALGYVGLAGVLEGKASTSPSKIWFENGRIFMEGLSNTDGFHTMRKIPGAKTPRYRGDKTPYNVPAREFEAFKMAVMSHWPMFDGESWEDIEKKCFEWRGMHWVADSKGEASKPVEPQAIIKLRSDDFTLTFKWIKDKDMFGMIGKLKTLPFSDRRYDAGTKAWTFKNVHLDAVKTVLADVYEASTLSVVKTDEITPPNTYNPPPKRAYRAGYRTFWNCGYRGY